VVLTGLWKKNSAGGCHLHSEEFVKGNEASWQLNPKYLLVIKGEGKADVEIVLSRTQWKLGEGKKPDQGKTAAAPSGTASHGMVEDKKKPKTIIGTMLGCYIFENRGQKLLKRSDIKEDVIFYPKSEIVLNKTLDCKETGYIIMPCTFEDSQEGPFMISCTSNNDFIFREYGNE